MNKNFKSRRIENEILEDLLNNNGEKYIELNNFIIKKFKLNSDEYKLWLEEADLRVYEDIDYDTVIDSWFYVQHLDSTIEVEEDIFKIIPPNGYEDMYTNDKLEYANTKEGLIEAFFETIMKDNICRVQMYDKDLFICIDEI